MRGQTGIGALIIFISFVLTATMAAFLITQTTVSTQSKAASVADQVIESIGKSFRVVKVEGIVDRDSNTINKYLLYVTLASETSPIDLNTTIISYYTANNRVVYLFGNNVDNESELPNTDNGKFYVVNSLSVAKENPPNTILEAGEMYVIGIVVNDTIRPSDLWRFTLIPKGGQPSEVHGFAPDVFDSKIVILK